MLQKLQRSWFTVSFITLFSLVVLTWNTQTIEPVATGLPMGGRIGLVTPCFGGLLVQYPTVTARPGSWIDLPVSIYGHKVPKHPGQNVLGKASPLPGLCVVSLFPPVVIPGAPVIFSGTSL